MHEIDLDGVPAWYYPEDEEIPPEVTADVSRYQFRYDALTMHHPRLRQVIVPKGTNGLQATFFAVLHWVDGTDLRLLDHMLEIGADVDDAIDRGLLCEVSGASCQKCAASSVLVRPFGGFGAGRPSHGGRATPSYVCPNCGDYPFVEHVEVLET
jgi:hypothetical protein